MTSPNDGWDEHERAQRRAWLALTPAERLQWLWSAKCFAARAKDAAIARRSQAKATKTSAK
jgi:hypothetical protein